MKISGGQDGDIATGTGTGSLPLSAELQQQRRLLVRQPVVLPPLLGAAMGGDAGALTALLADPAQRAAVGTARDGSGRTALHFAANGACVRALCACGADVGARDTLGGTPLHAATERQCAGAVRELLAAAEGSAADACNARCVNAQNMLGDTALHIAVRAQCLPICTLLCAYKPDLTLFVFVVLHLSQFHITRPQTQTPQVALEVFFGCFWAGGEKKRKHLTNHVG